MTVAELKRKLDRYQGQLEVMFDFGASKNKHIVDNVDEVDVEVVVEFNGTVYLSEDEE